ncbi:MAG: hypothetical protein JWR26_1155 [Pedosphaera sp.]|nr:hypothetical protein [Pedosphaera sp.]
MILSNQRVRLAIDTSQMGSINDVITAASPEFWNGVDLQFELAFFYGAALLAVSNLASITVDVKSSDPRTGLPLMSKTISSGSLNQSLTLNAWNAGAPADCHALVSFTNQETNLDLGGAQATFWLVVSALTNDSPAHRIVLGATAINVIEGGEGVTPPASVVNPTYYTAAQSDARYNQTTDLTTINTTLTSLQTQVTAVQGTANAAVPKAGGTMTGSLNITGLSGVLKGVAGVVTGGATTTDLAEGSNLYWTQARFNTAVAAVSGAASGLCPLDSSSLIPASFLPSITVHNTFVVASQAAMLALSAHQGDVAIRTDLNQSFILLNNTPSVLGNWTQLLTPTSAVTSVNGSTGTVTLTTANIAEGSNLYYTAARARVDVIAASLTGFSAASGGAVTSGDSILSALGRLENRTALNDAKATGSDRVKLDGTLPMTGMLNFTGTGHAGLQLNNLTDAQRSALTPANGMLIYNSTLAQLMFYNGNWQTLGGGSGGGTPWLNGTGAPASNIGSNGGYYLDDNTGAVYVKTGGAWAQVWAGAAVGGSTYSGPLQFTSAVVDAILFGSGAGQWKVAYNSTVWNLEYNYSGTYVSAMTITTAGGTGSGLPELALNGVRIITAQQPAITDDASGAANQAKVNAILAMLRTHGLIHA